MSESNGGEPLTEAELLTRNKLLTTWVIGLVTGCEGCTEKATAWVESMDDITTQIEKEDG
jgi:hypothetical protein